MHKFFNFDKTRKAVSLPEVALILALLSIVVIVAFKIMGQELKNTISTMTNSLKNSSEISQTMASNN